MKEKLPSNVVVNDLTKERFTFQPGGTDVCRFDFEVGPGGGIPMLHQHAGQSEIFRCREGELTVLLDGEERTLKPGDELRLTPGQLHAFVNRGTTDAKLDVEYRPAGRNEAWLKVVNAGVFLGGKEPGMLDLAPFINDVDIYIKGPPIWVQRMLFAVLKPLAVLLGRRRAALDAASQVYGHPVEWR